LLYIVALTVFGFPNLADELRYGQIDSRDVAEFVTAMLVVFIMMTGFGYLLGYLIGTISAGVFLVIDRKWDAGKPTDSGATGVGSGGASVAATSQIPPTGKWWLDWIARSPVRWLWQNRRRPVRIAIVLTVVTALFYLLGIPFFVGGIFQQPYLLGAGVLVPLIGLSLAGVFYAGWRAPLVFCLLGTAAVAYPVFRLTHESWVWSHSWRYDFPDVSPVVLAACTGIGSGLIAAGFYGWVRWTQAGRVESARRGRVGLLVGGGFIALLIVLGLNVRHVVDLERQEFVWFTLANEHLTKRKMRGLARLPNLKELELVDCDIARGSISELGALSKLEVLSLFGSVVTDEDLQVLRHLSSLEYLRLSRTNISDAGLEHLASVHRLKYLGLDRTNVTGPGLVHLKSLPRLVGLNLEGLNVTDEDLPCLRHFPSLGVLYLSGTNVSDAGLEHLAAIPSLERLFLDRTKVAGHGLAHLKDLPHLTHLDLSAAPVDGDGLSHLPPLPALQCLLLSGTRVDDAGLSRLPPLPALHYLDLSGTRVTGDGLVHVKRLPALRELYLSQCDIQDEDLKVLYDFPLVWFHATSATEEGQRALEDAWRELEDGVDEPPGD
jgi:hypothetical protein